MTRETENASAARTVEASTEGTTTGDGLPAEDPTWGPEPERTWATGERRPAPPTAAETARFASQARIEVSPGALTCIRVALQDESTETLRAVLDELRTEPGIISVSPDVGCGPDSPDAFDVLLATEHDSLLSSSAISTLDRVDGVAFAAYPAAELANRSDEVLQTTEEPPAGDDQPDFQKLREEVAEEMKTTDYDDVVDEIERVDLGPADDADDIDEASDDDITLEDIDLAADDEKDPGADGSGGTATNAAADSEPESPSGPASENPLDEEGSEDEGSGPSSEEVLDLSEVPDDGRSVTGSGNEGSLLEEGHSGYGGGDNDLDADAVFTALVDAFEERNIRESELATLREALGIERRERLDARVETLSDRVDTLLARSTVNGDATDTSAGVEELESKLDAVAERLEALESEVERQGAQLSVVTETGADHEDSLEECLRRQEEILDRQEELADRHRSLRSELSSIEDDIADLRELRDGLRSIASSD